MDKLMVLANQEQHDALRFRETMALRDQILKTKLEIENMEKQSEKLQQEINAMQPKILQTETDIKMLETQRVEVMKNIKDRLARAIKDQDKLKNSKDSFQYFLREKIEKFKDILKKTNKEDCNATTKTTEEAEVTAAQKRVWVLLGQIEALEFFESYQVKKIKEIDHIVNKVGVFFEKNLAENHSENNNDII